MMFRIQSLWLSFLVVTLAGCNTGAAPTPILIGHVADKTRLDKAGDQAELGIRLALHELSKDDALATEFGGRSIEVRHTDADGKLDAFEAEAVRLDAINRCLALIGGLSVPETLAMNHAKLPLLTLHGQPAPALSQLVFYMGMSPIHQATVLARTLAENPKTNRIALFMDDKRPESIAFAEAFQKSLIHARAHVKKPVIAVSLLHFGAEAKPEAQLAGETKWRDLIERLAGQEPQAVIFAGSVQDFNAWHKVLRKKQSKSGPQVVFAGSDGEHRLFEMDGDEAVTVLLATAFCPDATSEPVKTFLKAYHDAFKRDADVHSVIAYDSFRILVDAMKRGGSQPTSEKLREELLKTKDFAGLTGPLTMTADRQLQRPLFTAQWQSGKLKLLKKFDIEKDNR